MSKTITLRIWNEQEGKVTKTVEIKNVLTVSFDAKTYNEINFIASEIEILIDSKLNDIEFKFSEDKEYVFITVKDRVEQ